MAAPLIFVVLGRAAYSFAKSPAGRKAAQEFIKNLGKRGRNAKITNTKPPNVKVTQGPTMRNPSKPNQPVNPKTGKFQKPSTTPAPKKPNAPPKKESKPSKVPSVPKKKPNAMTASPKKPSRPGDDAKVIGGSRSKPSNRDYSVRNVPRPKPKDSAAALARISTLDSGPKVDTKPPEDKKKKEQDRKTKPKTVDPKKTKPPVKAPPRKGPPEKKKPSKKPQQRPAQGPVTNESFAAAFKRNRSAKKPTFTWKGKLYTTRYKEESISEHKKKFGVEGKYK